MEKYKEIFRFLNSFQDVRIPNFYPLIKHDLWVNLEEQFFKCNRTDLIKTIIENRIKNEV